MRLELKGDFLKQKQNVLAVVLIAVIVLVGGWVVYSNFFAGSGGGDTAASQPTGPGGQPVPGAVSGMPPGTPGGATPPPPGGPGVPPGQAPATAAPGAPTAGQPPASPGAPGAPPSQAPAAPASQPKTQSSTPPPSSAPAKAAPKTITVFGSVTVTYPTGWGIAAASGGSAAVISDGKARFEVQPPDRKATNAKGIANAAVSSYAKNAAVTAQGATKIGGYDAYFCVVKGPMGPTKIVGIDAPTRVVIIEYVRGGQLAAYKSAFDSLESQLKFK